MLNKIEKVMLADEVKTRIDKIDGIESSLAETVTFVPAPNGVDDTAAIQNALNKKGHVKINKPGVYIVNRLVIDSDTFLDISLGVTIKKKNLTNTNILTNKGYLNSYRNKNIHIKGGIWDCNASGNPSPATGFDMVAFLLKGIDGLKITDVDSIGNELKYCYLIADCTNIYCGNIKFANESDGLHFQPPINNLLVENITGWTHDDMVAFTMGDYTAYALGTTGNIENVIVRNIFSDNGTDEHIKLVGDGLNHTSKFRNMLFENIRGEATVASVCIMQRDQAVANAYLTDTFLENIVFSRVNPKVTGNVPHFLISATSGDVTIENGTWDQSISARYIQVINGFNGKLDKLTVRNIKSLNPSVVSISSFVRCDTSMVIKQLNIEDCKLDFSSSTNASGIYMTNNSIKKINIINSELNFGTSGKLFMSDGTSAERVILRLMNCDIKGARLSEYVGTPIDIYVSNSVIDLSNHLVYFYDGGDVRFVSDNSKYTLGLFANGLNVNRKLALNGVDFGFTGLLSILTPIEGDKVRSANASEPTGKGLYYYNGTAWVKYAG